MKAAFWQHFPEVDQDPVALVAQTLGFWRETDTAFIKLMPMASYQVADLGIKTEWNGDFLGRRDVIQRPIEKLADWQRVSQLAPQLSLKELEAVQVAKAVSLAVKGESTGVVPVLSTVFSPVSLALMLAGSELFYSHFAKQSPMFFHALESLTCRILSLVKQYQDEGISGIFYVCQHFPVHSALAQFDRIILDACTGFKHRVLHIHGDNTLTHDINLPLSTVIPKSGQTWQIHYEPSTHNVSYHEFRRHFKDSVQMPVVPAFDLAFWHELSREHSDNKMTAIKQRVFSSLVDLKQTSACLTAPCVLPLEVTTAQIKRWCEEVKRFAT